MINSTLQNPTESISQGVAHIKKPNNRKRQKLDMINRIKNDKGETALVRPRLRDKLSKTS